MSDYAYVLVVAAGTLAMRASMVTMLADITLPARLEQALGLVAPAVLAGLVAQTLLLDGGAVRIVDTWLIAAAAAAVIAWRTRSFGWTLVVGMGLVWVLEAMT